MLRSLGRDHRRSSAVFGEAELDPFLEKNVSAISRHRETAVDDDVRCTFGASLLEHGALELTPRKSLRSTTLVRRDHTELFVAPSA